MKAFLFSPSALWQNSLCLLRIWCGVIFIKYGSSILHLDSIFDFADTLKTVKIPFPLLSSYLCKSSEFFGGILLVLGLVVRPVCIFLIIDMAVATFIFHHAQVLNNGLTTFLLLLCLTHIFSHKADAFTIDYLIAQKLKLHE
jgi:putative oxidoreductase